MGDTQKTSAANNYAADLYKYILFRVAKLQTPEIKNWEYGYFANIVIYEGGYSELYFLAPHPHCPNYEQSSAGGITSILRNLVVTPFQHPPNIEHTGEFTDKWRIMRLYIY